MVELVAEFDDQPMADTGSSQKWLAIGLRKQFEGTANSSNVWAGEPPCETRAESEWDKVGKM